MSEREEFFFIYTVYASDSSINTVKSAQCPRFCHEFLEIVQLFIDKGANVNAMDKDGHTVLDAAIEIVPSFKGKFKNINLFSNVTLGCGFDFTLKGITFSADF